MERSSPSCEVSLHIVPVVRCELTSTSALGSGSCVSAMLRRCDLACRMMAVPCGGCGKGNFKASSCGMAEDDVEIKPGENWK